MIYLIGGVARSGKSIIRKKLLDEYKISGIGTDSIRYMLSNTNPELGIDDNKSCTHNGPLMWPYLDNFIYELLEYSNENFVIEGDVLLPEYLSKYIDNPNVKCCYIGYSNTSVDRKSKEIVDNRYEGDWTKEYTEKEFREFIKWSIEKSSKYKKECEKLGLKYYDTGIDFKDSLDNIVDDLLNW